MMMNAAVDALRSVISHQDAWIRSDSYKTEAGESKLFPLFHSGPRGLSFTFSLTSHSHPLSSLDRATTPKLLNVQKIFKLMMGKKENYSGLINAMLNYSSMMSAALIKFWLRYRKLLAALKVIIEICAKSFTKLFSSSLKRMGDGARTPEQKERQNTHTLVHTLKPIIEI